VRRPGSSISPRIAPTDNGSEPAQPFAAPSPWCSPFECPFPFDRTLTMVVPLQTTRHHGAVLLWAHTVHNGRRIPGKFELQFGCSLTRGARTRVARTGLVRDRPCPCRTRVAATVRGFEGRLPPRELPPTESPRRESHQGAGHNGMGPRQMAPRRMAARKVAGSEVAAGPATTNGRLGPGEGSLGPRWSAQTKRPRKRS
jgi:hypothetical protein